MSIKKFKEIKRRLGMDIYLIEIHSHEEYLAILKVLMKDTKRIEILQIDGKDSNDPVLKKAKQMMPLEKEEAANEFHGSVYNNAEKYSFVANKAFFDYLTSFESFFISKDANQPYVKTTDFGFDDIAFLGQNNELLFHCVTHEGLANIDKRYADFIKNI